ncbi:MAG: hypothetical protein J2P15_21995 [Micromonosporaceae bacterium]|nr:hypothetical protein [Micromonosporaceae bacterium]
MTAVVWRINPHTRSYRRLAGAFDALAVAVDGRAHWELGDGVAHYAPAAGMPVAVVRPIRPSDSGERYHVAIVHDGAARRSRLCQTAEEAVEWAELDHSI